MRSRWRTKWLGVLIVILGLVGCVTVIGFPLYTMLENLTNGYISCGESLSTPSGPIDNIAHIKLPPSTKNLEIYFGPRRGGNKYHCSHYIRFEMQSSDLDVLLSSLSVGYRFKLPLSTTQKWIDSDYFPQKLGWNVDNFTSYLSGKSINSLDYNQIILIDTTHPEFYIVYAITDYED